MKKIIIIILIITLFTINKVEAEELTNNLELKTSITYNNLLYYFYRDQEYDDSYLIREPLHSGVGSYGELIYWINKDIGIAGGFDIVTTNSKGETDYTQGRKNFEYENKVYGPFVKAIYQLSNNSIISSSLIYYNYNERYHVEYSWKDDSFDGDLTRGNGLGLILGVETDYSLTDDLSIIGTAGYRRVNIDLKEEYNWNQEKLIEVEEDKVLKVTGLRISGGISYKF